MTIVQIKQLKLIFFGALSCIATMCCFAQLKGVQEPNVYDVVIVCHSKDFDTLDLCIKSIKKNFVDHRKIFLISNEKYINPDVVFVHENNFYKYINPFDMKEKWAEHNPELASRAFWVFQQFLKLGASLIIDDLAENYMFVDADTMWLKPQHFMKDGRVYFGRGQYRYEPYFEIYRKLLHEDPPQTKISFICHHMLFNQTILHELLNRIQELHGKPWYEAIFNACNFDEKSTFSEQELYGNWVYKYYPKSFFVRTVKWIDVEGIPVFEQFKNKGLDFIAAHWYLRHLKEEAGQIGYPSDDTQKNTEGLEL